MLEVGSPLPEFRLPNQRGESVSLAAAAGHWLLLWFYPKADTPG